jgi:hypothetical protein
MKRFLSTLVQFGSDIAPDTGDRVRALVFSLVVRTLYLLLRLQYLVRIGSTDFTHTCDV